MSGGPDAIAPPGEPSFLTVPALLRAAAERFGPAPALVTGRGSESFAELLEAVVSAAAAIRSAGAAPGDRVLLVAANSPAAVHGWLGAVEAGTVPAAVNPDLTRPELEYVMRDLAPALVISDRSRVALGAELAGAAEVPAVTLAALAAAGSRRPAPGPAPDPLDVAAIVYTSGTSSRPKGVLVRHAAYTETGRSFPGWIELGGAERLWACLPFFHINAQAYSLMSALAHGHGLAISDRFHASTFWADAQRLGVTSVNLIGAMVAILERQPESAFVDSRLRTVYAAPAPGPEARGRLEERFRVRIVGGYGMSENTFGCVESPSSRAKPGSVGRPRQPASGAFVNELSILDPEGRPAGPGEVGELCFRNPLLTPGYWNAPEVTAAALRQGWLHTGDAGRLDAEGDVHLVGRYKEMIRRRGENISPAEVEDALTSHPEVAEAAAFGMPAQLGEEDVVAAVVLRAGGAAGEEELRAWARRSLAPYKVPVRVVFRDSLPFTATMRVARETLRSELRTPPWP